MLLIVNTCRASCQSLHFRRAFKTKGKIILACNVSLEKLNIYQQNLILPPVLNASLKSLILS